MMVGRFWSCWGRFRRSRARIPFFFGLLFIEQLPSRYTPPGFPRERDPSELLETCRALEGS